MEFTCKVCGGRHTTGACTESPKKEKEVTNKVTQQANEIKEGTPKEHLPEVISNLEQYIKLRTLNETTYENLPDNIREEIGTRDPMDEFIDTVGDFEGWDYLTDAYGFTPDNKTPKWTIAEIKQLVSELKQ